MYVCIDKQLSARELSRASNVFRFIIPSALFNDTKKESESVLYIFETCAIIKDWISYTFAGQSELWNSPNKLERIEQVF